MVREAAGRDRASYNKLNCHEPGKKQCCQGVLTDDQKKSAHDKHRKDNHEKPIKNGQGNTTARRYRKSAVSECRQGLDTRRKINRSVAGGQENED